MSQLNPEIIDKIIKGSEISERNGFANDYYEFLHEKDCKEFAPALAKRVRELEAKLDWMTKKRWALEMCIGDMSLMTILRISSNSDHEIREAFRELSKSNERAIAWAGGISVYTTYDKDDFKQLPPCYSPPKSAKKGSAWQDIMKQFL